MNTAVHSGCNTILVRTVMNTAAQSGCNTAYIAQCYEHGSTEWK